MLEDLRFHREINKTSLDDCLSLPTHLVLWSDFSGGHTAKIRLEASFANAKL